MTQIELLLRALHSDVGEPSNWRAPVEFHESLALCALNSAYSLRATSSSGVRVLDRYRALRPEAATDDGPDLLRAMDAAGGPEEFAHHVLDNRSKLPGTKRLRTVGIYEGLTRLAAREVGVISAADLRHRAEDRVVEEAWRSVAGFGPLAWSYLLMNAGVVNEIKPDEMVQRYLARTVNGGRTLTSERAKALLQQASARLGVEPRSLDRAIWLHESPSGRIS